MGHWSNMRKEKERSSVPEKMPLLTQQKHPIHTRAHTRGSGAYLMYTTQTAVLRDGDHGIILSPQRQEWEQEQRCCPHAARAADAWSERGCERPDPGQPESVTAERRRGSASRDGACGGAGGGPSPVRGVVSPGSHTACFNTAALQDEFTET